MKKEETERIWKEGRKERQKKKVRKRNAKKGKKGSKEKKKERKERRKEKRKEERKERRFHHLADFVGGVVVAAEEHSLPHQHRVEDLHRSRGTEHSHQ